MDTDTALPGTLQSVAGTQEGWHYRVAELQAYSTQPGPPLCLQLHSCPRCSSGACCLRLSRSVTQGRPLGPSPASFLPELPSPRPALPGPLWPALAPCEACTVGQAHWDSRALPPRRAGASSNSTRRAVPLRGGSSGRLKPGAVPQAVSQPCPVGLPLKGLLTGHSWRPKRRGLQRKMGLQG